MEKFLAFAAADAYAQVCTISGYMVNHNRYAYDTAEECLNCPIFCHSVPFGNWGVSSNVGSKRDADQFQGWYPNCNPGSGTRASSAGDQAKGSPSPNSRESRTRVGLAMTMPSTVAATVMSKLSTNS